MKPNYLEHLRSGQPVSVREQIILTLQLSWPAVVAQIASIIMQYIDAGMVGHLGADASASIGLVASATWLFGGLAGAITTGFNVLVSQRIGAGELKTARNLMKQALVVCLSFSMLLMLIGVSISGHLPQWLGAEENIWKNASSYFFIYAASLPIMQVNNTAGGMLQSSGNMRTPSICLMLMCPLDVLYNFLLIFPTGTIKLGGIPLPGAGMGVTGAALGTALAQLTVASYMAYYLLVRSPELHLRSGERLHMHPVQLKRSIQISAPVIVEKFVMAGAQVVVTAIVAPLGNIAIAANSFAITAESLCYMPGFGVENAASILVGQSIGAERKDLTHRLGFLTVALGMGIMTITGILLYIAAPWMLAILSPDQEVIALGTRVLRIEAFAEPLYAASIVASGVFQGAGWTLVPTLLNFISMWGIRIPLAAILSRHYGLPGVWAAMALELCVRGILFLIQLLRKRWLPRA